MLAVRSDRAPRRWPRRLLTIPGVILALALVSAALPALVVLAFVVDLLRSAGRRTLASVRLVLFFEAFLLAEVFGLALLALTGLVTLGSPARRAEITWPVQRLYTALLMAATRALFSLRFEIEGDDLAAERGPMIVFIRHASIIDTLIPSAFIANRHEVRLRYVLKRELLVDPCLDVAGHWIPNYFAARDGADSPREIESVRALKSGLGQDDGVLIYPEGTRFTAAKRRKIIERLLRSDPAAAARAEGLKHLLPLRHGGALALLDAAPSCDALFVGHSGLEGFASIADIWAGALVGRTVHIKIWRERAAAIPDTEEARIAWLEARWQRLDDWILSLEAPALEPAHA
ncbi:phospholipid/glycerol acyltransferase [Minicystis rosea]|nr:phospholipid/glycerol acyltransferase [Minicystis rosea]